MLQLDVARLKRFPGGSTRFDLQVDMPPIKIHGESIKFSGPVKVNVVINNTGKNLAVNGKVYGMLKLTCSRCLELFDYSFEVPIEETYTMDSEENAGEAVPFTGDFLDIAPEVLKSIIMYLPMKALCREECLGLCPRCGRSLNEGNCDCGDEDIDPRLSVLRDFFEKNNI